MTFDIWTSVLRDLIPAQAIRAVRQYLLAMVCNANEDYIWQVVCERDGSIDMKYIGFCPLDTSRERHYDTYDDAPDWIRHGIAVLQIMPPDPYDSTVFGLGRRIDTATFWIVQPVETLANDT